jgi:hypothetical protein
MSYLLILVLVVLVIQILIFYSTRSGKQANSYPSGLEQKYHIKTRADAWRLLNNPELSEAEKIQIEDLYKKMK